MANTAAERCEGDRETDRWGEGEGAGGVTREQKPRPCSVLDYQVSLNVVTLSFCSMYRHVDNPKARLHDPASGRGESKKNQKITLIRPI